jgi:hypothetical protein
MVDMAVPEALRKQHFHFLSQEIGGGVTEQGFHLSVGVNDLARAINDDQRVRGGIKNPAN